MGSRAFAAVARAVLFVHARPRRRRPPGYSASRRTTSAAPTCPTLTFRIESATSPTPTRGRSRPAASSGSASERSIREALEAAAREHDRHRSATSEAADWLRRPPASQGGTDDSATIKREGAKAGHSQDALQARPPPHQGHRRIQRLPATHLLDSARRRRTVAGPRDNVRAMPPHCPTAGGVVKAPPRLRRLACCFRGHDDVVAPASSLTSVRRCLACGRCGRRVVVPYRAPAAPAAQQPPSRPPCPGVAMAAPPRGSFAAPRQTPARTHRPEAAVVRAILQKIQAG